MKPKIRFFLRASAFDQFYQPSLAKLEIEIFIIATTFLRSVSPAWYWIIILRRLPYWTFGRLDLKF
jgi:hypothetical protein